MVINKIRKMTVKVVKIKSESFFLISPGVFELWRKNLRGGGFRPPPPAWIGLSHLTYSAHSTHPTHTAFPPSYRQEIFIAATFSLLNQSNFTKFVEKSKLEK